MNNFTMEELEIMHMNLFVNERTKPIIYKIIDFIDNYCEHEWVNGTYCEKCGRSPT